MTTSKWHPDERWVDEEHDWKNVKVLEVYEENPRYGVDKWEYRMGYKDTGKRFVKLEDAVKYAQKLLAQERTQQACVVDYEPEEEEEEEEEED